jgi:hypothetical protein
MLVHSATSHHDCQASSNRSYLGGYGGTPRAEPAIIDEQACSDPEGNGGAGQPDQQHQSETSAARADSGVTVQPYWSQRDQACVNPNDVSIRRQTRCSRKHLATIGRVTSKSSAAPTSHHAQRPGDPGDRPRQHLRRRPRQQRSGSPGVPPIPNDQATGHPLDRHRPRRFPSRQPAIAARMRLPLARPGREVLARTEPTAVRRGCRLARPIVDLTQVTGW